MAGRRGFRSLYYISPIENLPSILREGILSHAEVQRRGISFLPIYDSSIVESRQRIWTPDGRSLWHFANLYFQPRNAMLYRVVNEKKTRKVVVLGIKPQVLEIASFISIGNAASPLSVILPKEEGIKKLQEKEIWEILHREWWAQEDGSKRIMMSECLVPERVPPEYIQTIYVADRGDVDEVKGILGPMAERIPVVAEPHLFFRPRHWWKVTDTLFLVDGDMFFSHMQTLTVSVNTVGVMGKGMASRAKYQFPDVYVRYQEVCRQRILVMGKPYLYKREVSLERELAEGPLPEANEATWFLLFPTKRHWRERSDIHGIEEGLRWIREHYRAEGIRSLAVPALGCGLGGLDWRDVGPLMARYLADLEIQVAIYLPQEKKVPPELLSREFLLGQSDER
ncbi:MAG: DarT ssDNA thymidine ADP-ribosyltransferase family protein [Anaerolineae bacterium]|nr:DarT ssDNA thymidine ADP-ribosyltransferase family protein [Anaerolineae bacterium]MCX8066283.1 DarT ssDNA thymidine ADP-ribosyltransferase family protein [Anaerolineae bacterium]